MKGENEMIKRCNVLYDPDSSDQYELENENGKYINVEHCIVCRQENMMLGDPLDGLNEQIQSQVKDDSLFDVAIVIFRKENDK